MDLETSRAKVIDMILGKRLNDIRPGVEAAGWLLRLTRSDKDNYAGTCDYRPNRIYVATDDGIITEAE